MRRCYLVCYDIRHPKRLRRVHKICKGFGESWQFSIFFCVLKPIDRVRLQAELEEVLNLKEDQVLMIDLGQNESTARTAAVTLGQSLDEPLEGMVVI
jgi:CRISPR-associated protein Cas2